MYNWDSPWEECVLVGTYCASDNFLRMNFHGPKNRIRIKSKIENTIRTFERTKKSPKRIFRKHFWADSSGGFVGTQTFQENHPFFHLSCLPFHFWSSLVLLSFVFSCLSSSLVFSISLSLSSCAARSRLGRRVGGIYRDDVDERILATLPEFFFCMCMQTDCAEPHTLITFSGCIAVRQRSHQLLEVVILFWWEAVINTLLGFREIVPRLVSVSVCCCHCGLL